MKLPKCDKAIRTVAFSEDNNYLVYGGKNKMIYVYDFEKKEVIQS